MFTTGCYPSADYADDVAAATCDWYSRCDLLAVQTYEDVDTCLADLSPPDTGFSCVDYDAEQAKDCIEALESAGCDALQVPESCTAVCAEPTDTADTSA